MAQLTSGELIAGYRIDGLAGHGGMGVVYMATQLSLGRTVALKLITPSLADDPRFRERFERESKLAAAIDHPNVLPVYEAGEVDGTLFIAMRWVDGTDLRTVIHRGAGLEPPRATRITGQVAAGLDAAHRLGLVHRDVKPANILITARSEHAYLTDFGLIKRIRGGDELTDSGEFVGTIDYIAPEQIRGESCDARSDVYSLGCVLFHCVAGRVPFDVDTGIAKIYAHLNETPPRVSELAPGVPPALSGVIERAIAKEPDDRYPSAGAFARAAASATATAADGASATAPASTVVLGHDAAASPPPPRRRGRSLPVLALLLLVASVGAAAVLFATGGSDPPAKKSSPVEASSFEDGALLETTQGRSYVIKAGARFAVPPGERAAFSVSGERARVVSARALRRIPTMPREGSLIRAYRSTVVFSVHDRTRQLIEAAAGADLAVVPSTGLAQIPVAEGRRRTQLTVRAPSFVLVGRRFDIRARVRSRSGIPTGTCVFYRVSPGRPKERANTPTQDGRCAARLKVGRYERVRYSVRFIGYQGWHSSTDATPPIDVIAG
jgi:serine/threonine protein kinase